MNIIVVADVLNELYYNGVIRSSKKLDERDFLQLARAATGSVIRQFYFDEKQKSDTVAHFVASCVKENEYDVVKDERGRFKIDFDYTKDKIIRLPDGNGILRITPIPEKGKIDYSRNYTKGVAGTEYLYCTAAYLEDTGENIYMAISDQIRLFTLEEPKKVEMLAVIFNDETEMPDDVIWDVINYVLVVMLKVIGIPVDMTDDSNPVVQTVKSKMATPQPL